MARGKSSEARLVKLVGQAIGIIQEDRDIAQSSFTDTNGRITNIDDRAIVLRYDRWLKAARAEVGKSEVQK